MEVSVKRIFIGGLILAVSAAAYGQQRNRPNAAPAVGSATSRPFLMAIEDVFSISGRGTVVTGRIETGTVSTGDEVEIVGIRDTRTSRVMGVEMFRRHLSSAGAGDNVGILLRGVARDQVERGQVLARPGSIRACAAFDARITGLRGRGGRNGPYTGRWRPQFYFRTTDITGTISGSNARPRVALIAPIAMNPGQQFSIREGGRTIGSGTVLRCR